MFFDVFQVSRFGVEQGVFPENEERVNAEMNQYAAGTFMYHAHGKSDEKTINMPSLSSSRIRHASFVPVFSNAC